MSIDKTYGGHTNMFGIVVDIPALSARYVRSALPEAPVQHEAWRRRHRSGRARRMSLGSRHG